MLSVEQSLKLVGGFFFLLVKGGAVFILVKSTAY